MIDEKTAIEQRHSVRAYTDEPIADNLVEELNTFITKCNEESDLHMQLVLNEPKAFDCAGARQMNFKNAVNYIALVGKKSFDDLSERCGYYGEKVVIFAQQLGLRTCWVAGTYKDIKSAYSANEDEKLVAIIAIGYGADDGRAHKSKTADDVSKYTAASDEDEAPEWFNEGVRLALLAPTAINQQKFKFTASANDSKPAVEAKASFGPYSKIDLGIVKYHFEVGAGGRNENFVWKA